MKWFLCFLLALPLVFAANIEGYVNDYANILSSESSEIESILRSLHEQGSAEFAIVTINSLEGRDIEGYAFELAEGRLGDKEKNNGLLLLVSLEDRKYRFEVGRGLEPVLPDIIVGRIGRDFLIPAFREGNYGRGILDAVKAVEARVSNNSSSEYYVSDSVPVNPKIAILILLFILFVFVVIIVSIVKYRRRHPDSDYFLAAWLLSEMFRGGHGRGGFGGFGGGSFGGGGAGGSW